MALHIIVGAGATGRETARLLAERGEHVRIVTRSGKGPRHELIESVAADATDADALAKLADGAAVLYNCASPPYDRWLTDWPPLAAGILTAAERTGAVLATVGNLYPYGRVDGPITHDTEFPDDPGDPKFAVRADMWRDALASHRAGRSRIVEVRAGDFIGPDSWSMVIMFVLPALARRRTVRMPVRFDVPHSFTYTADVARTLIAVGADSRAWGRPWLVPSPPPVTVGDVVARLARLAGQPVPRTWTIPGPVMRAAGLVNADAREFNRVAYQWRRPFTIDPSVTERTFGLAPTPLDEALADTLRWWRTK